jgi:DNA-binding LacI/PurR family transcriptional regulator
MREMGRDACRQLFAAITGAKKTTVQYSMTLVVRESTAAPRRASGT